MQTNISINNPFKCLKDILKTDGVKGLYAGMAAPLGAQIFMNSLSFAGDSIALKILEPDLRRGQQGQTKNLIISGMFGGFLQCLVLVPSDLIKCKIQYMGENVIKPGPIQVTKEIIKTEGVLGLYRGFSVTAIREIPAFGIYFYGYKASLQYLRNLPIFSPPKPTNSTTPTTNESALPIMIAGAFAGSCSWGMVYPVDVVKTHVQLSAASTATFKEPSFFEVAKQLYNKHGLRVYSNGLAPTIIRAAPVNAVIFFIYEKLKVIFKL
jgi:solute carrier family 25 carnitine/acylcarnitine transporter 20/29